MSRHRVVVVGAGFGGLATAIALRSAPVEVTIVDANNFHTFQPLLYQVATAGLDADDVAHPIRAVFRARRLRSTNRGTSVVMGRVDDIETGTRTVTLTDGRSLGYDTLVIAAGAITNDFGVPGVADHAFGLKSIEDALALRTHVLTAFERAAQDDTGVDGPLPAGALDVVVCGGGPTGVEMAGGLSELYRMVLAADFPDLPVDRARITLVEAADRLLTPFTPTSSARARRTLERMGVDVRLGVGVERVEADAVVLADGTAIPAATCVWAAGVRAHPLAEALGVELERGGRIPVDDDLSVVGCRDVFAIGDIAAATDPDGNALPQVAQPAIQGGRHVAAQIARRLAGDPTEPFRYVDKGSMATIGRHSAVTELSNGWRFGGFIGWAAWLGLHLVYLMGFRNRLNVFVNWCWNYLTYDRASRLLFHHDVAAERDGHDVAAERDGHDVAAERDGHDAAAPLDGHDVAAPRDGHDAATSACGH